MAKFAMDIDKIFDSDDSSMEAEEPTKTWDTVLSKENKTTNKMHCSKTDIREASVQTNGKTLHNVSGPTRFLTQQEVQKESTNSTSFASVVRRKCRAANKKLTKLQESMLQRSIAQYRDMVETRTLPLPEALDYVEKIVDFLISDASNAIAV